MNGRRILVGLGLLLFVSALLTMRPSDHANLEALPADLMLANSFAAKMRKTLKAAESQNVESQNAEGLNVDSPLPSGEAAAGMRMPPGFHVSVFAAEPDVRQPISMCIDDRGRVWVAEAYSYPVHGKDARKDRILVFEDVDGNGNFDKRTVFYDKLNYVTGLEVGFGGVWVMSPPYFYFIPDRDGDDHPDGDPEVVLDGFGNFANAHNLANGFAWGPDGWLYGTHGRTNWSMIGKPGDADSERRRFDGGVYRYHPVRRIWEPYVDGCTNPWGIDWDDYGQAFIPNTVNPHLFHAIAGAHFEPWRNRASSRFAYQRIQTIADHLHFSGGGDVRAGIGSDEESDLGGGHSHCGIMVYLGDSWPKEYRNTVLMHNTHGRRINRDILQRSGSGYVAKHGPDFLRAADSWYMGVTLQVGPGGEAYSIDWSDTGECHSVRNTRRHTGRIYQIRYGKAPVKRAPNLNVAEMSNDELVKRQLHRNDWYVRHARRVLQERAARGDDLDDAKRQLLNMLQSHEDPTRRLRALWALHVTGGLDEAILQKQLKDQSEYVRAWAINLICEQKQPTSQALTRFAEMARIDKSALVRLHLASAMQRLPAEQRWAVVEALSQHAEDRDDQNLPHMIWYAVEPLVEADVAAFAALAARARIPLLQENIARRIASLENPQAGLVALTAVLQSSGNEDVQRRILDGVLIGLRGRRGVREPSNWSAALAQLGAKPALYERTLAISLVFGRQDAIDRLKQLADDGDAAPQVRAQAIGQLVAAKPKGLEQWLVGWLMHDETRRAAIRGLADAPRKDAAEQILSRYSQLSLAGKNDALQTLTSRSEWAKQLLDAVEAQTVPRADLTAYTVRQIAGLQDETLQKRVESMWGTLRPSSRALRDQIKRWKRQLSSDLDSRDRSHGRAVYKRACAACHKLFDDGGNRGPNLTGAQRNSLDYLLEHIVDPNTSVAKDYQMRVVQLRNGRTVSGLAAAETATTLTLLTQNDDIVVAKGDIETSRISDLSLMPEKLLDPLSKREVRNLMAYLQGETQAPLPDGWEEKEVSKPAER